LVLPVFEPTRPREIEAIEESPADLDLAGVQALETDLQGLRGERDGRALQQDVFSPDLLLEHRETLREGVVGEVVRGVRPEQIGQVVAGESTARFNGKSNQQRKVFARAKPYRLAGGGKEDGTAEGVESWLL